jgi:anti-sigma B factor antagonist
MDQFKIETTPGIHAGIRIIRLSGPFTLQEIFDFQSIFRETESPVTLIDVTDVPYLDSAALGSLLAVHVSSQKHQRQYALVGASERLRNVFRLAEVDSVLVTYPSLDEAQKKFASQTASN